ncbi:MAG: aldolase/citrate lyase family protein [Alphaproteobacteria bacterium]
MAKFKDKLNRGETVIGPWISLSDPVAVEIIGRAGFDFLLIDGEHAPFNETGLRDALIACDNTPAEAVIRVRANEEPRIKLALDLGADGVLVPMVNTPDDARQAVKAAKYPMLGGRGVAPWRASKYYQEAESYIAGANDATALIIQIEHKDAVADIDAIIAVEGVDAIFVGPADLTASLGHGTNTGNPDTLAAIERVAEACTAKGMAMAIDCASADHMARWHALGYRFFTFSADIDYLDTGARAAVAAAHGAIKAATS